MGYVTSFDKIDVNRLSTYRAAFFNSTVGHTCKRDGVTGSRMNNLIISMGRLVSDTDISKNIGMRSDTSFFQFHSVKLENAKKNVLLALLTKNITNLSSGILDLIDINYLLKYAHSLQDIKKIADEIIVNKDRIIGLEKMYIMNKEKSEATGKSIKHVLNEVKKLENIEQKVADKVISKLQSIIDSYSKSNDDYIYALNTSKGNMTTFIQDHFYTLIKKENRESEKIYELAGRTMTKIEGEVKSDNGYAQSFIKNTAKSLNNNVTKILDNIYNLYNNYNKYDKGYYKMVLVEMIRNSSKDNNILMKECLRYVEGYDLKNYRTYECFKNDRNIFEHIFKSAHSDIQGLSTLALTKILCDECKEMFIQDITNKKNFSIGLDFNKDDSYRVKILLEDPNSVEDKVPFEPKVVFDAKVSREGRISILQYDREIPGGANPVTEQREAAQPKEAQPLAGASADVK